MKMSHPRYNSNRDGFDLDLGLAGRSRELLAIGKSEYPRLLAQDFYLISLSAL